MYASCSDSFDPVVNDYSGTACKPKDIDLSPGAYGKLADPDRGRVDVTWAWLSPTAKIWNQESKGQPTANQRISFNVPVTDRYDKPDPPKYTWN